MSLTYRCYKCKLHVSSCLCITRCPSCNSRTLRQYQTKEYRQMAKAPSLKLNPYPNYEHTEKGDF